MTLKSCLLKRSIGSVLVFCFLLAAQGNAAVIADPASITFTAPTQSFSIALSNNGTAIPAGDIRGWQLIASGHDYKHMITVEKANGALKITPSPSIEVGSYDLNIDTAQGPAHVQVFAPLSDVDDIVQKLAALTELSEKQVAQKMGLLYTSGRADVEITLPPVYYEGQTLVLNMADLPGAGHRGTWFMNGTVIAEGLEKSALEYTFHVPGEYVLSYVETEQKDGKASPVARARAYTRVVAVPAVPTESGINVMTEYSAPAGFRSFAWRVDAKEVAGGATYAQAFDSPGVHRIECLASDPIQGPADGYLRVRYDTTVR